jgi:hypothetical protein
MAVVDRRSGNEPSIGPELIMSQVPRVPVIVLVSAGTTKL